MDEKWDQARVQAHIDNAVEESINLDYKAAGALDRSDGKKKEITKDVSAMANSAGGLIIYGIKEYDEEDKKHLPEAISPIDRTQFSKEWLEQVINTIQPPIPGLRVHPAPLDNIIPNGVAYVVEIPESYTAHQARDLRYYMRYNFESKPMEDHMVRMVMNRVSVPDAEVEFSVGSAGNQNDFQLKPAVKNKGRQIISHVKLEILFPHLKGQHWTQLPNGAPGYVKFDRKNNNVDLIGEYISYHSFDRIVWRSKGILFPSDSVQLLEDIHIFFGIQDNLIFRHPLAHIKWKLYADNMPMKEGTITLYELLQMVD